MLKFKKVNLIDVDDWDNLVEETYGKIYSLQQQDGCRDRGIINISIPDDAWEEEEMHDRIPEVVNGEEMGVKFETWLKRDPAEPLNPTADELKECNYYWGDSEKEKEDFITDKSNIRLFWERNFYPFLQTVANNLHKKGLIESGDYMIKIDW